MLKVVLSKNGIKYNSNVCILMKYFLIVKIPICLIFILVFD